MRTRVSLQTQRKHNESPMNESTDLIRTPPIMEAFFELKKIKSEYLLARYGMKLYYPV